MTLRHQLLQGTWLLVARGMTINYDCKSEDPTLGISLVLHKEVHIRTVSTQGKLAEPLGPIGLYCLEIKRR